MYLVIEFVNASLSGWIVQEREQSGCKTTARPTGAYVRRVKRLLVRGSVLVRGSGFPILTIFPEVSPCLPVLYVRPESTLIYLRKLKVIGISFLS